MSERRWGRVTVEGWIEESPLRPGQVTVWSEGGLGGRPLGNAYPNAHSAASRTSVEFLPEPVTFKDGDAFRGVQTNTVYVRSHGEWWFVGGNHSLPDESVIADLRSGYAVRLVPEANGG